MWSKNLLILVDASAQGRLKIKNQLQSSFRVLDFAAPEPAWTKALQVNPQLMVLVQRGALPDRWRAVRYLRSHSQLGHLPLLCLLDAFHPDLVEQGLGEGADLILHADAGKGLLQQAASRLVHNREGAYRFSYRKFLLNDQLGQLASEDEQFLSQFHDFVRCNMHRSDLQISEIADYMALSCSQLDRRLQRLMGMSPKQFVSEHRLCAAYLLLRSRRGNVSEVSTLTGFKSLSYFSTRFSERFQSNPSVVRESRETDIAEPWRKMAAKLGISGPEAIPVYYSRK